MKKVLLLLILLTTFITKAQEKYKVVVDYNSNNIYYFHMDKNNKIIDTLQKPKFKRNGLVTFEIKNLNPFAVDVVTDIKEESLQQTGDGFNFSSLLGGISSFGGDNLKLNVQNLPANSSVLSGDKSNRGAAVANKFTSLNEVTTNIAALKSSLLSNLINPNLDKQTILQNLKELAAIQEDIRLSDPNKNFYLYLSNLEKIVATDKQEIISDVNIMSKELEQNMDSEKPVSRGELSAQNAAFNDLQNLVLSLNETTSQTSENLTKIKSLYTLLEASSFDKTFDYQIEADRVNFELKFVQSDFSESLENNKNATVLKTRNIKIFSKGGFKINTSVALTMNNFGNNSKEYFISDTGVIGADNNNYYVPNLATLINFFPLLGENVNIGGCFGLSIPISDTAKGINFLFGPSLILGSKNSVSISGGIAYGPTKKLTNGLQIGDETSLNDIENYTKDVYNFGYFFGISFSLFDIK